MSSNRIKKSLHVLSHDIDNCEKFMNNLLREKVILENKLPHSIDCKDAYQENTFLPNQKCSRSRGSTQMHYKGRKSVIHKNIAQDKEGKKCKHFTITTDSKGKDKKTHKDTTIVSDSNNLLKKTQPETQSISKVDCVCLSKLCKQTHKHINSNFQSIKDKRKSWGCILKEQSDKAKSRSNSVEKDPCKCSSACKMNGSCYTKSTVLKSSTPTIINNQIFETDPPFQQSGHSNKRFTMESTTTDDTKSTMHIEKGVQCLIVPTSDKEVLQSKPSNVHSGHTKSTMVVDKCVECPTVFQSKNNFTPLIFVHSQIQDSSVEPDFFAKCDPARSLSFLIKELSTKVYKNYDENIEDILINMEQVLAQMLSKPLVPLSSTVSNASENHANVRVNVDARDKSSLVKYDSSISSKVQLPPTTVKDPVDPEIAILLLQWEKSCKKLEETVIHMQKVCNQLNIENTKLKENSDKTNTTLESLQNKEDQHLNKIRLLKYELNLSRMELKEQQKIINEKSAVILKLEQRNKKMKSENDCLQTMLEVIKEDKQECSALMHKRNRGIQNLKKKIVGLQVLMENHISNAKCESTNAHNIFMSLEENKSDYLNHSSDDLLGTNMLEISGKESVNHPLDVSGISGKGLFSLSGFYGKGVFDSDLEISEKEKVDRNVKMKGPVCSSPKTLYTTLGANTSWQRVSAISKNIYKNNKEDLLPFNHAHYKQYISHDNKIKHIDDIFESSDIASE